MARGTIEQTCLQEQCVGAGKSVGTAAELSKIVAGATSITTMLCLSWRSGDEVSNGGHMVVPSMGQAMCSSTMAAASSVIDRSDKVHIDPIT